MTHINNLYDGIVQAMKLGKDKNAYFIVDKSSVLFRDFIKVNILRNKYNNFFYCQDGLFTYYAYLLIYFTLFRLNY